MRKKSDATDPLGQAIPPLGVEPKGTPFRSRAGAGERPGQAAGACRKRRRQVPHENLRTGDARQRAAPAGASSRVARRATPRSAARQRPSSSTGRQHKDRRADRRRHRGAWQRHQRSRRRGGTTAPSHGADCERRRGGLQRLAGNARGRRPTRPRRSVAARDQADFRAGGPRPCRGCWQRPPVRSAHGPATSSRTGSGRRGRSRSSRS